MATIGKEREREGENSSLAYISLSHIYIYKRYKSDK